MGKVLKITNRKLTLFLFVVPAMVLYAVFTIFPIFSGMYYSFTDWNGLSSKYNFTGIKNYLNILKDSRFQKAIFFNIRYTFLLVVCIIGISMILALLLNKSIKGKTFFRGAFFFPGVISMLTAGLIFNEIFFRALPVVGEFFNIEILKTSILGNAHTAIFGVLIVNVWQGVAIPTVMLMAGLQSIPTEMFESAALDGASKWKQFLYITIPFILPVLTVVFILVMKDGLTIYDYIMGLTSGGPGGATESVSLLIYNHGFKELRFSYSIAEAVILSIFVCCISFIQISLSKKKKVY